MTLQRRLVLAVLLAAALAWVLTSALTYLRAEAEINELYDTDMVRMAQQMQAVVPLVDINAPSSHAALPTPPNSDLGAAGLGDLAIAAWRPDGKPLHIDPDGDRLPRAPGGTGFANLRIDGKWWRLYYLDDEGAGWRVCVGQLMEEREELILSYIQAQALPWLFGLPLLIGLLFWAVRTALAPVRTLSAAIERRAPDDPAPLDMAPVPGELRPLVEAMNQLLRRVSALLEHERRLTADAAHELRTPLAALKAQWEVARRSANETECAAAAANVEAGIARMSRLVSQLLTMSRLEEQDAPSARAPAHWPEIARQALSDCLALAQRKDVDVEMEWPPAGTPALPIDGDPALLAIMLRNLLDNAIRYSPAGTLVRLRFGEDAIVVEDNGPGVAPDALARLGDRFFRETGQREHGNGLGISIARRVAHLHGLAIAFTNRGDGHPGTCGLVATITRDANHDAGHGT